MRRVNGLLAALLLCGGAAGGLAALVAATDEPATRPGKSQQQAADDAASRETRTKAGDDSVREAPKVVRAVERGVGRRAPDGSFQDVRGRAGRLEELAANQSATVVAITSTTCPLSAKYLPTLVELERTYAPRGVAFVLLNPVATEPAADMRKALERFSDKARYIHDPEGKLAQALGATSTTDVIVLDRKQTVVYHGAVDDQYGLAYALPQPRQSYLVRALDAVLADRAPAIAATTAPGCTLEFDQPATTSGEVTYHNRISRLVAQHCLECHRPGGVGPFSLTSYADIVAHKGMIRQVVERQVMPPWFAAAPAPGEPSPWINDRSLPHEDRRDLLHWLNAGNPEGQPADAPRPPVLPGEWQIGQPDLTVELPRAVAVKATGTMPYQNLIVETNLEDDQWIQAMEIRPTSPEVVHHVLVFVLGQRGSDKLSDEVDGDERRGFFAAYVPGNSITAFPEGFAKRLPKKSRLLFQMHYTPNGTETTDRTRLGLRFSKQPPQHEVKVVGVANTGIRIPAGASNHQEKATQSVPADVRLLAMMPHMHVRGKAFRYDVKYPDGKTETLLDIPRYDFNWQLQYRFAEPPLIPAGSTLHLTATYDNSDGNPANPDPGKNVRWGPQTFDEMMLGYVEYYVPNAGLASSGAGEGTRTGGVRQVIAERLRDTVVQVQFRRADADSDGHMTLGEARRAFGDTGRYKGRPELLERSFLLLDTDKSGRLSPDEFARYQQLRDDAK